MCSFAKMYSLLRSFRCRLTAPHGRRFLSDSRGTTAVEFATVLPVFLMLVLGSIEVGRALKAWNDMNSALGRAVRMIYIDPAESTSAVETFVKKYLVSYGVDPVQVSASPQKISNVDYMKISVDFPFHVKLPFASITDITLNVNTLAPRIGPTK